MITALSWLTLSPGFNADATHVYVHGASEIRPIPEVGMRGDVAVFVGSQRGDGPLVDDHTLFMGSALHPMRDDLFDPYVGFQPGLTLVRARGGDMRLEPVASGIVGANLMVSDFFQFFGEVRQVAGRDLVETRVAFGLGTHLTLRREDRGG